MNYVEKENSIDAFTTGGGVLDKYLSALKPSIVEATICTKDWHLEKKVITIIIVFFV